MLALSNSTHQTLEPGELVMYDTEVARKGRSACHKANNGTVCLRDNGIYELMFRANVSGDAGTVQELAIMYAGKVLPETIMQTTIATAADELGIASVTLVNNICDCSEKVFVKNIGETSIDVINPCFVIKHI